MGSNPVGGFFWSQIHEFSTNIQFDVGLKCPLQNHKKVQLAERSKMRSTQVRVSIGGVGFECPRELIQSNLIC